MFFPDDITEELVPQKQYFAVILVGMPSCASYVLHTASSGQKDRRWNADKPAAALNPYIPTWFTTSPANHRPANFWFLSNIEMKLWKVVQSQVQLMSNFKFEVPLRWLFQVQIITNIVC